MLLVVIPGHRWSEQRLSGVGLLTNVYDGLLRAPVNPQQRYDDVDYVPSPHDEIVCMRPLPLERMVPPELADPNALPPEETPFGYPCHASCWGVLEPFFSSQDVPLHALNRICRSIPNRCDTLNWGHDYGGRLKFEIDLDKLLPGEESKLQSLRLPTFRGLEERATFKQRQDPLEIAALERALADSIDEPPQQDTSPVRPTHVESGEAIFKGDCFATLPPEILDNLLLCLPSKDLRSLRLASRTIKMFPLSQSFWMSRFQWGFEFEWIFEARLDRVKRRVRDWRRLYLRLTSLSSRSALANRKRIWGILKPLADLLVVYSSLSAAGSSIQNFFEPSALKDDRSWRCACGAMKLKPDRFNEGCIALFERVVTLTPDITGVYVSLIDIFGTQYVTGLRFVQVGGSEACLGYNISGREVLLELSDLTEGFFGFEVVVSSRGVQALAILDRTGCRSNWGGSPGQGPRMRLFSTSQRVLDLKGAFDGFKMISLCIPELEKSAPTVSGRNSMSLRESDPWIPEVPPAEICLNEQHLSGQRRHPSVFQPFQYILFGGLGGLHRHRLIRMAVWMSEADALFGIELEYNIAVEGKNIHTLGRCNSLSESEMDLIDASENNRRASFEIDGPHGELIETCSVAHDPYFRQRINAIQVSPPQPCTSNYTENTTGRYQPR
ncbi:MAG: hypothetical protein M1837_000891 [Sclerophora amabilis]|nr:MAG: hypothetical protein M1837_000891 [Sclerophora amabilis]